MQANALEGKRVGFIGAGNMAEAIVQGILKSRTVPPNRIMTSDPIPARRDYIEASCGVQALADNAAVAAASDILVLAVKPQNAGQALDQLAPVFSDRHLLISIVAGLTCAAMQARLPAKARIVRTVPNTPVFVGDGMVAIADGATNTDEDLSITRAIFEPVARTLAIEEKMMDAIIGLSGSGPAYVFLIAEALTDGGVKMGLPRTAAYTLAAQTLLGAARMCLETGQNPSQLKEMVTSPGGTTIAALHALETGGVRAALMNAVEAATRRSEELGKLG